MDAGMIEATRKAIWISAGFVALALGVIGIVLPLLPTTPFLLLAAMCFARSSQRLYDRLVSDPRLGPLITAWQREGAIPRRAKIWAFGSMALVFGLSVAMGLAPALLLLQGLALGATATFIATRPTPAAERQGGKA
jgi:uncharacterized membrane protein YbaN (DUF454 family)